MKPNPRPPTPDLRPPTSNFPRLTLALSLFLLYIVTLAPSLSWANNGADGGDLIAAAISNGVAHPSGYPLYLLLVKPFLWIPFGTPAFGANLFSAVCAIGASLIVCEIVSGKRIRAEGILAGFAFGASQLLWSQAVIAEVYALHAFLIALNLCLLRSLGEKPSFRNTFQCGIALGLALSNHLTSFFLLPIGLALLIRSSGKKFWNLALWLLGLSVGLLPYALLPLWASGHPPVNWGGADSVGGFRWLIMGEAYRGLLDGALLLSLSRWGSSASLLIDQFGIIGLGVVLVGSLFSSERRWSLLWLVATSLIFAAMYNTSDSYLYLLPAFLACAIWLGEGLKVVLRANKNLRTISMVLCLLAIFWNMIPTMKRVDASQDHRADEFMVKVLQNVPLNAIIVTSDDRDTFALWYAREALGVRRDVMLVVERLLQFEWYRQSLKWTYPDLDSASMTCRTVLDRAVVMSCDPK